MVQTESQETLKSNITDTLSAVSLEQHRPYGKCQPMQDIALPNGAHCLAREAKMLTANEMVAVNL